MQSIIVNQPAKQLGAVIQEILEKTVGIKRIVFISAFVGLRTVLRIRDRLLSHRDLGAEVVFNIGFDMFGTSKNVLEELTQWNCRVFLTHNALPRVTFHPKIYLVESESSAIVIVGSNNLTDGGMYTNFEAATLTSFKLPEEAANYRDFLSTIGSLVSPTESGTTKQLTPNLLSALASAGLVLNESESRRRSEKQKSDLAASTHQGAQNPFDAVAVPLPPLNGKALRTRETEVRGMPSEIDVTVASQILPSGPLVWEKKLPSSDVLVATGRTNPVGGVRLTQAGFKVAGVPIQQTLYFRQLFNDYHWEQRGKYKDQEHTFVPMRVRIGTTDHGIVRFEISHKPTGEAGQGNYTTMLHWGNSFSPKIRETDLTGYRLQLFETPGFEVDFFLDIQLEV